VSFFKLQLVYFEVVCFEALKWFEALALMAGFV
jgi:hypothetical protein